MRNKWVSRKFLLSAASFFGSVGTSIAALNSGNSTVAAVGIVCSVLSAAIFSACEAYVDAAKKNDDIQFDVDISEENK